MWVRNVFGDVIFDAGIARQPGEIFQPRDVAQAAYFLQRGVYEETAPIGPPKPLTEIPTPTPLTDIPAPTPPRRAAEEDA